MDTLLNEYLLNEVSNINHDFVKNLVSKGKKQDICAYVCHFVCDHVLSNNLWVYTKLKEYFELIEGCKPSERNKLTKLVYAMCHLVGNADKGSYTFYYPYEKSVVFTEDIKNIRFSNGLKEFAELSQLQPILTEEAYVLLSVMFEAFMYSVESKVNLQRCFVILRYFLTLSPRQYIQGTTRGITMDIIDFVFLICVWYGNNPHCTDDLRQYIALIKDIYYYKLKKKEKVVRINILFYLIYVIMEKRTINQPIDYDGSSWMFEEGIRKTLVKEDSDDEASHRKSRKEKRHEGNKDDDNNDIQEKCSYLYILTEYDTQLKYEVDMERERTRMMAKLMRASTKEVDIDTLLMRDPRNEVQVVKLPQ